MRFAESRQKVQSLRKLTKTTPAAYFVELLLYSVSTKVSVVLINVVDKKRSSNQFGVAFNTDVTTVKEHSGGRCR
jgi:hypothetical protein